jgi:predicted transposase YbfD/YdcC
VGRHVIIQKTGQERTEVVYGVTSLNPERATPGRVLDLVRGHWHIENKSHWVRDVTFDEDRSQVRCGSIPQVMAALRNAAIGLLRWAGHTNRGRKGLSPSPPSEPCRRFSRTLCARTHNVRNVAYAVMWRSCGRGAW